MLNKGSLLVLASQFVAVGIHSLAKLLEAESIDPQQILQVRMFLTLGINCLVLKHRLPEELPLGKGDGIGKLLALRAVGGICGSLGFYYSLEYLPLADATTLNLLAPLGASIFTIKNFGMIQAGAIATCFLGVGLIAKPQFVAELFNGFHGSNEETSQPPLGFLFAMIGVVGGICAYTAISKIGARSHPLVVTNCFASGILVLSSIYFALVPGTNFKLQLGLIPWGTLVLIGLCGTLMEYLLTAGLSDEKSGIAVYMIYVQVVLALLVDAFVWHTVPDIGSCVGVLLVVAGLYITQSTSRKEDEIDDTEIGIRL